MSAKIVSAIALTLSIFTFAIVIGTVCTERRDPETKMHEEEGPKRAADQIISVLKANSASFTEWCGAPPVEFENYAKQIGKIDFSRCPVDFQKAWIDYVSAVQQEANAILDARTEQRRRRSAALVELCTAAIMPHAALFMAEAGRRAIGREADAPSLGASASNAVTEAFARCKEIAVNYGVRFHPTVPD